METWSAKPQLRVLLDHLATIKDTQQSWKVAYPLREVLLLVVCGTIACGDDYEDIVEWGEAHLSFFRGFSEFYHGIPCANWLRVVMNRIDPDLFAACFSSWVGECLPNRPDLVAIEGRRRSAAMIASAARRRCTWYRHSPPPTGRCWVRKQSMRNRTRSPPFRLFWSVRCPGLNRRHGMQHRPRPEHSRCARRNGLVADTHRSQSAGAAALVPIPDLKVIAVGELDPTPQLAVQHHRLLPQRGILCFKPALRLEDRGISAAIAAGVKRFCQQSNRTRFSVRAGELMIPANIMLHLLPS
jgi:hypothetical protein